MKEPSIETDYPIGPEHWDVLKPTKTGKYSNVDLTGMRFGKWLVLGPESYHKGCGWYWHCHCDCGTEKPVNQRNLLEGKTNSCGCTRSEHMKKIRKKIKGQHSKFRTDLTGQHFGRWTVLGKAEHQVGKHPVWECQCECGAIRAVAHSSLVNGQHRVAGVCALTCRCTGIISDHTIPTMPKKNGRETIKTIDPRAFNQC